VINFWLGVAIGLVCGALLMRRSIAANDARVKQTILDLSAAMAQCITVGKKESTG
jgi:hypothetical protein